jgi:LPS-assembly protein
MARTVNARLLRYSLSPLAITAGAVAASANAWAVGPDIHVEQASQLPRTDFGKKPALSTHEPVLLEAEQIDYQQGGVVIASGRVVVTQGDTILLADQLAYDQEGDLVFAKGNVSVLDPSGNVAFGDEMELSQDMKKGVIQQFKARFNDDSVIAAVQAKKIDENKTELFKVLYSPCHCIDEETKKPVHPLWSVKSKTALIDQEAQKVAYDDVFFNLYDVPIFYSPYLSHATPGADNKSGFLIPEYSHNINVGSILKVPYYYAIAPDRDATIVPIFTGNEGIVMAGEYRQKFDAGLLLMNGSATDPQQRDAEGNPIDGREFRGHINAQGRFTPNEHYNWGFDLRRTTDDTYLRRYNFSQDTVLTSRLYGEGFDIGGLGNRSYISAMALSFQGLTAEDDSAKIPTVLPHILFAYESPPGWQNSRATFDGNILSLYRDEGDKSRRLSTTTGWNLPYLTHNGQIIELRTQLRADAYSVEDVLLSNGDNFAGTTGRLVPQVSATWRWPFLTRNMFSSIIIEPIVMLAASPGGGNPETIPNEDSVAPEFTDTNLFDPNRYAGYDRIENGPRASYGMRGQAEISEDKYVDWLVGQNYRVNNSGTFPYSNDVDGYLSDYVGKVGFTYDPVSLAYRFRLDKDTLAAHRQEVDVNVTYHPVLFTISYLSLNDDPSLEDKEVVSATTNVNLTKQWQLTLSGSDDLELNQVTGTNAGLIFTNECMSLGTYIGRTYTNDRDIKPSTTILFRISLKNLE